MGVGAWSACVFLGSVFFGLFRRHLEFARSLIEFAHRLILRHRFRRYRILRYRCAYLGASRCVANSARNSRHRRRSSWDSCSSWMAFRV